MSKPLIIANWKANPVSLRNAEYLARGIEIILQGCHGVDTVIAPPFPFLQNIKKIIIHARLGAQDLFWQDGPYTGEVSASLLKNLGVRYAIIGHSERRIYMGETDAMVNQKIVASLSKKITPILCVGERERTHGEISPVLGEQLKAALRDIPRRLAARIVVAYEPIWAISTNPGAKPDTPDNAFRAAVYIRRILADLYGRKIAEKVRVIYGGSVKEANIRDYLKEGKMGGVLVGSASLSLASFSGIIRGAARR